MRRFSPVWLCGVVLSAPAIFAQEADQGVETITQEGLHFRLPPDWPVEKRGGVLAPIPVEEYLSGKMKTLESRIHGLEQQMSSIDLRMRVLEEKYKQQRGLRSVEAP